MLNVMSKTVSKTWLQQVLSKDVAIVFLPLFAALLLDAANQFFVQQIAAEQASDVLPIAGRGFASIALQLGFESLPFFFAHHLVMSAKTLRTKAILQWSLGYLAYPMLCLILVNQAEGYASWALLSAQGWLFMVLASVIVLMLKRMKNTETNNISHWRQRILSLDGAVALTAIGWGVMMAGMFMNEADPMRNQPLPMKIDFGLISVEFGRFVSYAWQFSLLALCAGFIFGFNRYVLIRKLLAEHGVFVFLCGALVTVLLLTPVFGHIILAMPINVPEQTLLPSEDHNPFAPVNFQVVFWILVFTTPVILAFERQQQGKVLAQAASEKTQSELQRLQQQINPHFLFNTLNNLYALTLEKSDKAPEMVLKLSDLLRYTAYEGQKEQVPLSQEVAYVQNYIDLQTLRFGDDFSLRLSLPNNMEDWKLPPLLLIILVENAFKHGVEKIQGASELTIDIAVKDNLLVMKCINSLPLGDVANEGGLGVANLERRLQLLQPNVARYSGREVENNQWVSELILELTPC